MRGFNKIILKETGSSFSSSLFSKLILMISKLKKKLSGLNMARQTKGKQWQNYSGILAKHFEEQILQSIKKIIYHAHSLQAVTNKCKTLQYIFCWCKISAPEHHILREFINAKQMKVWISNSNCLV